MRALVLSIVLLAGCQKQNEITNSQDLKTVPKEIANGTNLKISLEEITNSIGMQLVRIPAGTFTMGSPMEEVGRLANETPHEVTLTKSYFLGVYEVTQDQYEKVMGSNPNGFRGSKNPKETAVEDVSWTKAVSFCKRLSEIPEEKAAGREYRLPTEAEWEYACRAGSTTSYSFGETAESLGAYAWFKGNSGSKIHRVGEKQANRWGLYDMHGNVWEWCEDRFEIYPTGASTDPKGPSEGSFRVYRGGCWYHGAGGCRSASRYENLPDNRLYNQGFRVALSPSVKQPEAEENHK